MQTKQVHPYMTSHMMMISGNSRRIIKLRRPLNFYFLAFCGVIYQNLLHRQVYCSKQLETTFHQFCENHCISPLMESARQPVKTAALALHLNISDPSLLNKNTTATATTNATVIQRSFIGFFT